MTSAQKVIKYIAIAFAIFLIITIISGILSAFYGLSFILGLKKESKIDSNEMSITNFENSNVATLEIDVDYTNLTIKTGENLKAETNNSNINFKQSNQNKLEIEEKNNNWFSNNTDKELVVYIPKDLEFEKVEIDAGAGKINIENIVTKNLSFELGAGETEIKSLNVSNNCNIEGGAGKVNILSGQIKNLDLEMGIGEINLKTKIVGKSKIDAGIGNLNIDLQGNEEDYKIKANKGIGAVKINGIDIEDGGKYGNGEIDIEINGGIGNIDIDFE